MKITIDGKLYELTQTNIDEIRTQIQIEDVKNMLECHTNMTKEEIEAVSFEMLIDMAQDFEWAVYKDVGYIERQIIDRYGFELD